MNIESADFKISHSIGESATHPSARLGGCLALSLLLVGASLPRRRFAPGLPPKRTDGRVQLRFLG
jgi:hypothetical protein